MNLILSRKGFDSSYGGHPSIILPNGKMISFPIPVESPEIGILHKNITYVEENKTLEDFLDEYNIAKGSAYHVDPEIQNIKIGKEQSFLERGYGTLGQCSSAAGHLANNGISADKISKDNPVIFLFWGLFKKTKLNAYNKFQYTGKPFHSIFGYLIAEEAVKVSNISDTYYPELKSHLHYKNRNNKEFLKGDRNIIFKGERFGTFSFFNELRLTVDNSDKLTEWAIPNFIKEMTYNKKRITNGKISENKLKINVSSRGQEFIVTNFDEVAMRTWLKSLGIEI